MGEPSTVAIEIVERVDDDLLAALRRLLPHLARSTTVDEQTVAWVVQHEACTLFTAALDGAVVGALTLVMYPLPTGLRAHVDDLVVDEAVRGRGVGETLLRTALDRAAEVGALAVDLTARPTDEAAMRLSERCGFVRRDAALLRWTPPAGG